MNERQERCETCRWWHRLQLDDEEGDCRRYPPSINPAMGEEESPGLFPLTESSLWCGEWKPLSLPVVERDTRPLTVLNLPVHVQNALERADILTVGFLVQCSKLFFTDGNVSGIGPKSLRDIRSCLAAIGLKLKGD